MNSMKRFYLLWMLLCVSFMTFAQVEIEHLTFEGIPIEGKRREFVKKLIQKDYQYIPGKDKTILIGNYSGYKDCHVRLWASSINDNIFCVEVTFPSCDTWADLYENYVSQKKALQQAYGQPTECTEKFMSDSIPDNDHDKIDEAWFSAKFEHSTGTLFLSIVDNYVFLSFNDKISEALVNYDFNIYNEKKIKQTIYETYKLFPTKNIWNFIKLDTRNGKMWQVQFDTGSNRFETMLNMKSLVPKDQEENGRFTLYPTTNTYNFILLDQIDGRTWQVQWSLENDGRMVLPINDIPNNY